jgi:O-antigen/teichoic acid export membrane protein
VSTGGEAAAPDGGHVFREQVRSAVIWRSGTLIVGQIIAWTSTFLVIRILSPADYGLFAMTSAMLVLLSMLNGMGLTGAVIQRREAGPGLLRQLFGMLIVINAGLALIQLACAPLVARYYGHPLIADMLRVQSLIYLTNPLFALGYAVLTREMDFRRQAQVNLASALIAAVTALAGALAGWGVWTLVIAPMAGFASRGLGMVVAARTFILPSFDFRGAWSLMGFGGMLMVGQLLWFVQSQADVIIAGRAFTLSELGFYTTGLFLAQIFVAKIVPSLNDVAFSAYARIQDDVAAVANGFLKSVRVIMLVAMPFCLGLAVVAEPAVLVLLGDKWAATGPIVQLLAMAMPFVTLHVMFAPATSAMGRPGINARSAMLGAVLMPAAYLVGVRYGPEGIAAAWLLAYPVLTIMSARWSLPIIGVRAWQLRDALLPPMLAGVGMALGVRLLDGVLPPLAPIARLALLVAAGGSIYSLWLMLSARERLEELLALARRSR